MPLFKINNLEISAPHFLDAWHEFLLKRRGVKPGEFIKVNDEVFKVGFDEKPILLSRPKKKRGNNGS